MTTTSTHIGGRSQVNFNFLQNGGDYPFINHLKTGQAWGNINSVPKGMPPTEFDTNGYPLSTFFSDGDAFGGVLTVFAIPANSNYSGEWVVKGVGTGTVVMSSITGGTLAATLNFVLGGVQRFHGTVNPSATTLTIKITSTDATNPISSLVVCRADEESIYDAGGVFSTAFKNKLIEGKFGCLRFLNWMNCNLSSVSLWANRKPLNYVFYHGYHYAPSLYAGITTNSGDTYSASAPSGWAGLIDKATVHVRFNATASTNTPTLNIGSTGDIAIKNMFGDTLGADGNNEKPAINRIATLVYDADLNAWIKVGGDSSFLSQGIESGCPPEIMLQLCNELGMHPWFPTPYLAAASPTNTANDFMSNLATYCKNNGASWMVPRFEGPNETWNTQFYQTQYANNKSNALWGASSINNWYGMVVSLLGQIVSGIYSADRTKYQVICGVQQALGLGASGSDPRLTSATYVSHGGGAAYNWVTHVAPSTYIGTVLSDQQQIADAYNYSVGSASAQATIAASYITASYETNTGANHYSSGYHSKLALYAGWSAWAAGMSVPVKMTSYEGGWSPDYFTNDTTASGNSASGTNHAPTITAITKAANAVVTLDATSALPVAGMSFKPAGVVGMVEVNGNTYTVVSVNTGTRAVTLNVDSTGFTTYVSGGTVTYVGIMALRNTVRAATKNASGLLQLTMDNYNGFLAAGGVFPSCFQFTGISPSNNAWSVLEDIYEINPPQFEAIRLFNKHERRLVMKT